jgi:hypothetical protein
MSSVVSTEEKGHEIDEKPDKFTSTLEPVLEETEVGYQLYKEAVHEGVTWTAQEEGDIRRKVCISTRQASVSLRISETDRLVHPSLLLRHPRPGLPG